MQAVTHSTAAWFGSISYGHCVIFIVQKDIWSCGKGVGHKLLGSGNPNFPIRKFAQQALITPPNPPPFRLDKRSQYLQLALCHILPTKYINYFEF